MKKILLFVSLLGVMLFFSSCIIEESPDPSSFEKILPLSIGNRWNYDRVWTGSTVSDTFHIEMSITGLDTIKSFIGYRLVGFVLWNWKTTYCKDNKDGLFIAVDPDEGGPAWYPPVPPQPLVTGKGLSYPTFTGDVWLYDTYVIRTADLSQSISVPAGTFTCIHYQVFVDDSLIAELWASPGIGIIKADQKIGNNLQVNSLVSYTLH